MLSRMNLPDAEDLVPDTDIHQLQLNAHLLMSPQKYEELQVTANDEDGWLVVMGLTAL